MTKIKLKWSQYIPHTPTSRQIVALKNNAKELFFGGALGGGKSDYLLMCGLQYMDVPDYAAIIFRKQLSDLKQPGALLDRARKWLAPFLGRGKDKVKYVPSEHTYYFPTRNGDGSRGGDAKLCFGYIGDANARDRYQSAEYQTVCFDELSHWDRSIDYEWLLTRLRRTLCPVHGEDEDHNPIYDDECPICAVKRNTPIRMRAACVDEGEVLTEFGWLDIRKVRPGMKVYSTNSDNSIELKTVLDTHEYAHKGTMVRIRKKNIYASFTSNHKVVFKKFGSEKICMKPWEDHQGKSIDLLRCGWVNKEEKLFTPPCNIERKLFYQFMGLYLSDGSINHNPRKGNYKIVITQLKDSVKDVEEVLNKMPMPFCRCSNGDYQANSKELWLFLKELGYAHEKYLPRKMFYAASTEELIELLFYLQVGDGSQRLNSNTYSTTSPKLKDLVMSLGVLLGYKVQENKSWDGNPKHREKYSIYLTANSSMTTKVDKNPEGRNDVSYENFEGKVYCLTVKDNQNFIIRQKGYVYITGNSNPGGVGNAWIKNYFSIVPDPTIYPDKRDAIAAIMQGIKVPFVSTHPTRVFVPSFLEDNPHLDKKEYDLVLENLDAGMKSALRDGNWEARVDSRFNRRTVKYFNLYDGMVQLGPIMHEFNIFTKVFFTVDPAGTVREGMTDQLFGNNAVSWTVISLWGVTKNNDLFFLDMLRFREEIPEVVDKVVSKFRQWKSVFPNVYVKMEVNGVGLGPSQYIRRLGVPVKSISKGKDKIANSTSAQLLMKAGKVYFPTNVEWIEEAEDEIFNWSGLPIQTDDIIDTFSDAANEVGPIEDVISQDENVEKTPKLSSLTYRLQRFEPSVTLLSSSKKPYPLKRLVV